MCLYVPKIPSDGNKQTLNLVDFLHAMISFFEWRKASAEHWNGSSARMQLLNMTLTKDLPAALSCDNPACYWYLETGGYLKKWWKDNFPGS